MADTAHDQAAQWLADRLHNALCGGQPPAPGDQLGRLIHDGHAPDAGEILDSCDVREEFGVRTTDGIEVWGTSEDVARSWITRNSSPLALIRRPVILLPATTPTTEATDG